MKYSKYANEWLVGFHKEYGDLEEDEVRGWIDDKYIVRKLVDSRNDSYMKPVWDAINKRVDKRAEDKIADNRANKKTGDQRGIGGWFFDRCLRAYQWNQGERSTRLEKKRELLAISKKAKVLAELVGGDDKAINLKEFTNLDKKKMLEKLDASLSGHEKINYWAERLAYSALKSILYEYNNPKGGGGEEYISEEEYAPFGFPRLSSILFRLSENLEAEAEIPPITAKPNVENAHHIVFVRKLTTSMRDRFGQPLRTVVANTACVIFGTDYIDEKFVRDNTRD